MPVCQWVRRTGMSVQPVEGPGEGHAFMRFSLCRWGGISGPLISSFFFNFIAYELVALDRIFLLDQGSESFFEV